MATVLTQKNEGTYTFASQPRPAPQRKKYRDSDEPEGEDGPSKFGNIMYDKRVVRGSTYARHNLPTTTEPDPLEVQRQREARRRAIARKRAREQLKPRTPPAVDGREHKDVQTELYLEELSDRIEEADVECQTDAFLDRPATPLFIPAKTGADAATQIYENDLFDFDVEVRPILEVLVGKTVEQALLEVMEEEELANLRTQQREFEELRNAEMVEQQRLEEQERRHREEKERRMKQQREALMKEKENTAKIAARAFAQGYLADLIPSVFGNLATQGYFYDPVERDVEDGFMPWLVENVTKELEDMMSSRSLLDELLASVVARRQQEHELLEQNWGKSSQQPAAPEPQSRGSEVTSNPAPEQVPVAATESAPPVQPTVQVEDSSSPEETDAAEESEQPAE